MACISETHAIRWTSTEVEPIGDFYELRLVMESASVSPAWIEAFNDVATRRYKETRGRPWGSTFIHGRTILVQELEEGAEEAVIAHLLELVEATNHFVEALQPSLDRQTQAQALPARAATETANRMRERFRHGP